ncbi:MAG: pyridoxal phosphate-dependent aminotransferase family protein [Spirochaetales bacterium]|nr:pyridoxal phosphate-dependent aminotransferase family protein [Spirochaetales bacterium]MBR6347346.1 pyridoxal phosphate-dependent aminotransferase family protein [Spirochaetales bacterium]
MDLFDKLNDKYSNYAKSITAKQTGLYPYFHCLQTRQAPEVIMEGRRTIMLGSNNYLGLTSEPEIIEAGKKAMDKYGTGCSGSRFLNGTLDLHLELEKKLGQFIGKPAVMTFSTGFQTNLGIISSICSRGDYIICDRENHASIYDGAKLSYAEMRRYFHNDMDSLKMVLEKVGADTPKLIITDGVFSMSGDIANLPDICDLAEKYNARVMVDDSHGIGTIGEGGRGTASYYGMEDKVDIIMGTFSKSFASLGGFAAASTEVIDYMRHMSRPFIFSASLTPANAATTMAALDYLVAHPEIKDRLTDIADCLRSELDKRGVRFKKTATPIVPIYTTDADTTLRIVHDLFEEGVFVNSVLPPATAENECLIRISLMANLTKPLIEEAADKIAHVLRKYF